VNAEGLHLDDVEEAVVDAVIWQVLVANGRIVAFREHLLRASQSPSTWEAHASFQQQLATKRILGNRFSFAHRVLQRTQ
jgi:hypothetical protein